MKNISFLLFIFSALFLPGKNATAQNNISSVNQGVTFAVSDVKPAQHYLNDTNAVVVMEARIGKEIYTYPKEFKETDLVKTEDNGLMDAILFSYAGHRPLIFTPDAIWLTICQGFSIHLNENHGKYEDKLFPAGAKPSTLVVRNDNLPAGKAEDWADLVSGLSLEVNKYTKEDFRNIMVPEFSTTTPLIRTVYEITMLESFKDDFAYVGESGCGIPKITLRGTKEDWEKIYNDVDKFRTYGLEVWVDNLKPVLKEFVDAFSGDVDRNFWQGLYKEQVVYMSTIVSGWALKFFPYIKESEYKWDEEEDASKESWVYKWNPYLEGENHFLSNLTTRNFPDGLASVKILWRNYYESRNGKPKEDTMNVFGGFMGIRQHEDFSLEPVISWAITTRDAEWKFHDLFAYSEDNLQHSPGRFDEMRPGKKEWETIEPLYAPEINKTSADGKEFLEKYLESQLAQKNPAGFSEKDSIRISMTVTFGGTIAEINVQSSEYEVMLNDLLTHLPYTWQAGYLAKSENDPPELRNRVNRDVRLVLFKGE